MSNSSVRLAALLALLAASTVSAQKVALPPVPRSILLDGAPFPAVEAYRADVPTAIRTFYASAAKEAGDGSKAHPWNDLQKALTALEPGDRLQVTAGRYTGGLKIDSSCRNGTSEKPIEVFFDGKATISPAANGAAVAIDRTAWHLSGMYLKLKESDGAGLSINGTYLSIDRVRISGGIGPGIVIGRGADHVTISNGRIGKTRLMNPAANSFGVEIEAGSNAISLINNHFHGNPGGSVRVDPPSDGAFPARVIKLSGNTIFDDGSTGIDIAAASHIQIVANTLSERPGSPGTLGIVLEGVDHGIVRSNHLSGYEVPLTIGRVDPTDQSVRSVQDLRVDHNFFETSAENGTAVDLEAGRVTLFNNNIIEGYQDGILVLGTGETVQGLIVANNLLLAITRTALVLNDPTSASLFDYNVISPAGKGVNVVMASKSTPLAGFIKQRSMPHTEAVDDARVQNGDLGRISQLKMVDRGISVEGIGFKGDSPDLGIAEH